MKTSLVLPLLAVLVSASLRSARADVVSDRVYLTTGTSTCGTGALGFHRVKQLPDGSSSAETGEFVVPSGSYLEITSVQYTIPNATPWARDYVQSLTVAIRQRTGTASTPVLTATYENQTLYGDSGDSVAAIGELAGPGALSHVAAFPAGPLMSSAGRLCAAPNSNNFWIYGGSVTVRGRLIPTGDLVTIPTTTTSSL
ncbi:MAG TPA: hypothetical protein VLT45_05805 [Kofleriaceae bacterium]|nr:hypothetical protein [Kofleriaceae bacterium]